MTIKLLKGDCLEIMNVIPDKSIDMILCDLPYGVTAKNKWDTIIITSPQLFHLKSCGDVMIGSQKKIAQ